MHSFDKPTSNMTVYEEKVGEILQKNDMNIKSDEDTSVQKFSASKAVAAARQRSTRKAGPLLILACMTIAILTVMLVPMFVGGASAPSSSAAPSEVVTVVNLESTADAQPMLGFEPVVPLESPKGYSVNSIQAVDGNILEIEYTNNKNTIVYRTARGNEDLSGIEDEFAYSAVENGNDHVNRSYAGVAESKLSLVVWANEGNSFAIVSKDAIDADLLKEFAENVA